jgi:hypothetical protein
MIMQLFDVGSGLPEHLTDMNISINEYTYDSGTII